MFYQECLYKVQDFVFRRLAHHFGQGEEAPVTENFKINKQKSHPFSEFIKQHHLKPSDQLLLCLVLVPHVDPGFFHRLIRHFLPQGGDFPLFGGVKSKNHRGILPTGETILFILAGTEVDTRVEQWTRLKNNFLFKDKVIEMGIIARGEPEMSAAVNLQKEYVDLFFTGEKGTPAFGPDFPARLLKTEQKWEDLVLTENVQQQIAELKSWITLNDLLFAKWDMHKKIKPGYRALFYGPPGTGKTLTATLLGKHTTRQVFRVDLSTIVSKYIGETEKNLEKLFARAAHQNWILFFDEADALFGKRTEVKDAHDRYANQEVSYLLQRVEDFKGLVILSSNHKANIDKAFLRRFNAVIKFPFPDEKQQQLIWEKSFPESVKFGKEVDFKTLASFYKLSGGNIINAIHSAMLQMLSEKGKLMKLENILHGIRREVEKEGKVFKDFPRQKMNHTLNSKRKTG